MNKKHKVLWYMYQENRLMSDITKQIETDLDEFSKEGWQLEQAFVVTNTAFLVLSILKFPYEISETISVSVPTIN